jgi:predicted ribosome quality control (RQC) complex YloA/Tae2 family protein
MTTPQPSASKPAPNSFPQLNWRELERINAALRDADPEYVGGFVDRVIVPERTRTVQGFQKNEWVIRFSGRGGDRWMGFGIRVRHCHLVAGTGKGPKASERATRSGFDLALNKQLRGRRCLAIESLPRERAATLWFQGDDSLWLGLVLLLIPARPEALLVTAPPPPRGGDQKTPPGPWKILARSRPQEPLESFNPPDGTQAPSDLPLRWGLDRPDGFAVYCSSVFSAFERESFEERLRSAERKVRENESHFLGHASKAKESVREAATEPDWGGYGELLKATLPFPPALEDLGGGKAVRRVTDPGTGEERVIPCDPKLGPIEQIEKFFQLERRRKRRSEEAQLRAERFESALAEQREIRSKIDELRARVADRPRIEKDAWSLLESMESRAGIVTHSSRSPGGAGAGGNAAAAPAAAAAAAGVSPWSGRSFVSRDGFAIWVGRSREENLELTFRKARGNDLWLHVRGRPGAHVVVPIPPGKTASLETLLDAAHLTIYYSGGESWGKTEVDYTFRKYVKKIKDSTEASYTGNRTLSITPDPERLKRLLAQQG